MALRKLQNHGNAEDKIRFQYTRKARAVSSVGSHHNLSLSRKYDVTLDNNYITTVTLKAGKEGGKEEARGKLGRKNRMTGAWYVAFVALTLSTDMNTELSPESAR